MLVREKEHSDTQYEDGESADREMRWGAFVESPCDRFFDENSKRISQNLSVI